MSTKQKAIQAVQADQAEEGQRGLAQKNQEKQVEAGKKPEYEIVMDDDVIIMGKFKEDSPPEIDWKNYAWEFGKEKDKFKVTLGRTTQFKVKFYF